MRDHERKLTEPIWRLRVGDGPLIATAIHDGHEVRPEVLHCLALPEADRLREEDPFTAHWTTLGPTRVVATRSRFEVDLNRPRDRAVYRTPADAWGLQVWKGDLPADVLEGSLAEYDGFYSAMRELLSEISRAHGCFIVYDLHTYNHRRDGPGGPVADPLENPQVNIGTGTMNRERFGPVVDTLIDTLAGYEFPGGKLDVRENVKFRGGHWPRWIHETFPDTGIAIAIEFKKFFMDEWTGEGDPVLIEAIGGALRFTVPAVLASLRTLACR